MSHEHLWCIPPSRSGSTPDFATLVDVSTAPSLSLLDGKLNIDLSAMASGDMTLLAQYTSASNYVFAYRQTGQFSVGSFLKTIPAVRRLASAWLQACSAAVLARASRQPGSR